MLRDVPGACVQYHPEAGPGPARLALPVRPLPGAWSTPDAPGATDIHKILIIGSGPIVIGQAAEFDYSGVQACKVLMEEGYEVVLVNSNPATIMTDPEFATATYIEPLTLGVGGGRDRAGAPRRAARHARRPDGAEPGARRCTRTARWSASAVELIGVDYDAIQRAEDRELFRETMIDGRPAGPALGDRDVDRGGRAGDRRHRPAADRAPGVHARRPRRRHRAHARPSSTSASRRASTPARSTRCCWSSR